MGISHSKPYFGVLLFQHPQKSSLHFLRNWSTVSPFSLLSLSSIHIFLLLMSGNVHPNPGLFFLYFVGAGNITFRGKLVPCSICSRENFDLFSEFDPLSSSHYWSCPFCCIVSPGVCFSFNTVSTFLWPTSMYFPIVSSNQSIPSLLTKVFPLLTKNLTPTH